VLVAQVVVFAAGLRSPDFFGYAHVEQKYSDILRLKKHSEVDVVVVGDSLAAKGFDPKVFGEETGMTAFNMGIPSTDMYTHSLMIRDFIIPHIKPKYILINIGAMRLISKQRSNVDIAMSKAFEVQKYPMAAGLLRILKNSLAGDHIDIIFMK